MAQNLSNTLSAGVRYIHISSCQLPYQLPCSSADYAAELIKGSNELASLLVCTRKKIFGWGLQIFWE